MANEKVYLLKKINLHLFEKFEIIFMEIFFLISEIPNSK